MLDVIASCHCGAVCEALLFQGVAAQQHPRLQLAQHTHAHSSSWLEHTPLCWCEAAKERFPPSALFGCRDAGYKSKNTNSDPQEGFAIHCSTSGLHCAAFLMHKAAVCKWGKTSPKSRRSKRQQQLRHVSTGTVGRSLRVAAANLSQKQAGNDRCFAMMVENLGVYFWMRF